MEFIFNQEEFKCRAGEFVFWFSGSKVIDITFSKNFKASVLLVEKELLNDNIPDQGRSIDATLHSNRFPVLHLHDKDDRNRILQNFRLLHEKSIQTEHRFYEEVLKFQMRLFILEMWHVFSNDFEHRKRSIQTGSLYERYMHLLQEYCMKEREVQFYANQLHITAKYLNAVCKQNSGVTASEWIQRFAKERLEILLQNTDLNISEIADKMEFSSRSFFTRYVKKVLGLSPSEYRNRLD
ncbi:helix-turn-helix domain-containing protein [uncultured Algoriphagus sp.]|uniref:helix-turn-helix domain-containing protein n=1 Tax=uncultured Algoriphagus sp. TaxID=417365 RepID=UPI0030EE9F4F